MKKKQEQEMNGYMVLKKYFLRSARIFLPVIFLLWVITSQTRFQECTSTSIENVRYILVMKNLSIKRGDIVSLQGHDTDYFKGKILAKRVIGLPGDQILHHKKIYNHFSAFAPFQPTRPPSLFSWSFSSS